MVCTPDGVVGDAVLVVDGVVAAVGDRRSLSGDEPERSFGDAFLLPGLRDAHLHPIGYAAALRGTTLATAADFDEVAARVRVAALAGSGSPVMGMRLNEQGLAERRLPTRELLDSACDDRPVLVHRYCGHVAIVNTAALRFAGIDADTPDPAGGTIDRDTKGEPTGVLRETAIGLVTDHLGPGNEVTTDELLGALSRLAAVGITSVGAILRTSPGIFGGEIDIAIAAAERSPIKIGALTIDEDPAAVAGTKERIDDAPERIRWLGIKRFGDGSFGGHTAAMLDPYSDVEGTGTLRLDRVDKQIAKAAVGLGAAAAIHAIGDRACEAVIDLFGQLIVTGTDASRLRIEHASVLTPRDVGRLSRYGISAVVQPPFLGSEADWLVDRIGPDRLERTYPFRTMDEAGITLAGSSDSPVESPDPWAGMALARDRAGLVPAESLTADRALAMYTTGAASVLGEPGPLEVGSPADLIVVDHDPLSVSADDLRQTQVLATFVDGAEVEVDRSLPLWLD